jgi:membrane-associated phospholipid phosphatase
LFIGIGLPRAKPIGFAAVNKRRLLGALAGAAALGVAAATARGRGRALDRRLFLAANRGSGPLAEGFFKAITEFGSIWACVGATAALAGMGRRRQAINALGAGVAMWGLGQVLKRAVLRPRPYDSIEGTRVMIEEPRGTSWPSSHPAVLLAFATVAARNMRESRRSQGAVAALAGAVGLSRIYLGVHYPADVVGGLLLGRAVADLWPSAPNALPAVLGTVDR